MNNFKNHWLRYVVGGFLAYTWSWLALVDVASISPDPLMGRVIAICGFLIIWLISFAIFMPLVKLMVNYKYMSWWQLVSLAFIWSFIEFFVSWIVAVIWIGKGGSVDTVLPFGSFTPLLMYTPLGFLARFVGYYGVSAIFVLCILVIARKDLHKFVLPVFGLVFIGVIFSVVVYYHPNGDSINVTIVAENLGHPQKINTESSELVVLPEYGLNGYDTSTVKDRFQSNGSIDFIGSKQEESNGDYRNIFIFGNNKRGFIVEKEKTRLIPAGESLPYTVEWSLQHWSKGEEILEAFKRRREVIKGTNTTEPIIMNSQTKLGGGVCSSIIATKDYRILTKQGATLLTNSASLEIFKGSKVFSLQHQGLAKFMAISNSRPYLQSANNGAAFALDNNGKVLAAIQPENTAKVKVYNNTRITPYTYLGEWMSWVGGVIVGVISLKKLKAFITVKHFTKN